jgi:surfeit locus 1 family protein
MAKNLAGLTALTLCLLALLVGLGVWQIQRLAWKEGLIAEIETRTKAPPVDLPEAIATARSGSDVSYLRVKADGHFLNDRERYLFAVADGTVGWDVITPLKTADGDVLLVNRGFVPDALRDPSSREQGEPEGLVTVTGLARTPETQGSFTPDNEPARNRWFWRDLPSMAASMFPGESVKLAPFFLDAEKSDVPEGWPLGGQTRLDLPNNHLQYAITWFALAAAIAALYVYYVVSRLRETRS